MQAQELVPTTFSIAQRTASASAADVVASFDAGRLVRTHVLRPTWHLVAAGDIGWMLRFSRERVLALSAPIERRAGIDADVAMLAAATIETALSNDSALTREELGAALAAAGIVTDTLRLSLLLMRAELDARIVSGPMRGTRSTYELFDARVPRGRELDGDAALTELTRRHVGGHGPTTAKDFSWWAGITLGSARRGLELTSPLWERRTCEGTDFFASPDVWAPDDEAPVARLLAAFDEFLLAYPASRGVCDVDGFHVAPSIANRPLQAIVLDGRVVGEWTRNPRAPHDLQLRVVAQLDDADIAAVTEAAEDFTARAAMGREAAD